MDLILFAFEDVDNHRRVAAQSESKGQNSKHVKCNQLLVMSDDVSDKVMHGKGSQTGKGHPRDAYACHLELELSVI